MIDKLLVSEGKIQSDDNIIWGDFEEKEVQIGHNNKNEISYVRIGDFQFDFPNDYLSPDDKYPDGVFVINVYYFQIKGFRKYLNEKGFKKNTQEPQEPQEFQDDKEISLIKLAQALKKLKVIKIVFEDGTSLDI